MSAFSGLLSRVIGAIGAAQAVLVLVEKSAGDAFVNLQGNAHGVPKFDACVTSMSAHTSGTITDGPCDCVWVTTDDATITGTMADGSAITTPALPNKTWVPISMLTAEPSAGSLYVGWYKKS